MPDAQNPQSAVLEKTVADARRLLDYAVSRGIVKDTSIITAIIDIEVKLASGTVPEHSDIENFLKAYNTLSDITGGVSGASLSPEADNDALRTKKIYTRTLIVLLVLLVPVSTVTLTGKRLIDDTLADINWICSNQPSVPCWEQRFPETATLQQAQAPINDPANSPSGGTPLPLQKAQAVIHDSSSSPSGSTSLPVQKAQAVINDPSNSRSGSPSLPVQKAQALTNDPSNSPSGGTSLPLQKAQAPTNGASDPPMTNKYDTIVRTYQIQQRMSKVRYVVYFFKPHKMENDGAGGEFVSTRVYADQIRVEFDIWYNTFAGCLLPIAFAALGAVTFGLRDLRQKLEDRTWTSQGQALPFLRIVIALLVGFLISLFSDFTVKSGLTPIALAFVIGYSVDVFFTFIDSVVMRLKTPIAAPAKSAGA